MKNYFALLAALILAVGVSTAAPKRVSKALATVVFTTDIDCEHCAQKVYNTIAYEKGVKDLKVDVPTKKITISYDAAKQSVEGLQRALEQIKIKVSKAETAEKK